MSRARVSFLIDGPLVVAGPTRLNAMFGVNLAFGPKVLYDQHSQRFYIVCIEGTTGAGAGARLQLG